MASRSAAQSSGAIRKNPYGGTNNPYGETSKGSNPHLSRLLKQLRPFQKEAYDYATSGIVSSRQFHVPKHVEPKKYYKKKKRGTEKPKATAEDIKKIEDMPVNLKGRLLLADEMGLGKSITSLAIMCHYLSEWPLLILCPASLRHIWPNEIEKFLPGLSASSIYVVQGFDDVDFFENESKRKHIQIVVATYSILQTRSASARCLQKFRFKCVIADESHNLKQKNSQRTQLAMPLLQGAKRLALLSGTPALARPVELWTQLHAIAPDLFGLYTPYTKQYCNAHRGRFGWDVNGLSNADELHAKLKKVMIRRLKADVLDELPSKQRSLVPIVISNKTKRKECEALMKELKETRQSVFDLVGDEASGAHFEARKLLMQAYQASGIAKASAVCEYLVEWLRGSGTQKVLIFAHHKGVLDSLEVAVAKELKGGGHIRIDGSVSSQDRAMRVNKFQTCSKIRVAILSMTAAGVGLTLTAASTVMFAELHWTPGVLAQAEDRCHRIGQRNAVNVLYLVCEDDTLSVDGQLWQMLGRKTNNLGRVIDGERDAGMGAKKAGQNTTGAGISVQDELQSFFADTKVSDEKASKVPVKGTIMSFFAKSQQKTPQSASKTPTSALTESTKKISKSLQKPSIFSKPPKASLEMIEWDCEACTFHNKQRRQISGTLACEMCGSKYQEVIEIDDQDLPSRKVTPASVRKGDVMGQGEKNELSKLSSVKKQTKGIVRPLNPEIVTIDDTEEPTVNLVPRNLDSTLANPIILNDDPEDEATSRKKRKLSHGQAQSLNAKSSTILSFSVSRNSGRITIHFGNTGESSLTNFKVEQIVTEETADRLMEARLSRNHKAIATIKLVYNQSALSKVIDCLDTKKLPENFEEATLVKEITNFVDQFMLLREVEKKLLKETGSLFSGINLRQQVLKLMPKSSTNTTERYVGGAKERARERVEQGAGDETDMAILEGGKYCAYCGGNLSSVSRLQGVSSTYCSRECADQGRLKRGWGNQLRAQVFALEGGVCTLCGVDGHALYTRVIALEPAERLNALCNANWKLPKSAKALDRLLQNPREGDFWQADHIQAVAEGGGNCGLENLRTLCVPCHAAETEKLHGRLKLREKNNSEGQSNSKKQVDIRTMFKSKKS